MAIASSNSEMFAQVTVTLHGQLATISRPTNIEICQASIDLRGASSFQPLPVDACDACPDCADRCSNENCQSCGMKIVKTNPSSCMFLGRAPDEKYFTICQIRRHNHHQSAWLRVGDTIYDATEYISKHPGGHMSILNKAGGRLDCTEDFNFHSCGARRMWRNYKVGKVCRCPSQDMKFANEDQCVIS